MAKVSRIHRLHLPTITYATVADDDDDDEEEYPHAFAFDFDSLSPPNHTLIINSANFNFSPNSDPDSDDSGLLADPDSFVVDDDQLNFVTDLFVTRDGNVTEDAEENSRVFLEDVYGDFGSDFDGVFLPEDWGDGVRVVGNGSEFDSQEVELNDRDLGVNVSSDISSTSEGGGNSNSNLNSDSIDGGDEPVRNLEWEVLLAVNNIERSLEFDGNDDGIAHVYDTDHEALFGQFLESEGAMKGSPPAAKSVVENLPLVVLKDEENKTACAVCKDEILVVEKVTELPCSHYYHWECIVPWLNIRNTCPVCRHELPTDDTDYERRKIGRRTGAGAQHISDFQALPLVFTSGTMYVCTISGLYDGLNCCNCTIRHATK
ncbi:uncharacterized protein LOC107858714 [Capsicum annuum]|uniref:uncharacterized protein LOC107858714 n=1 Tax=Capsicum annuum TaxID=4072 RepID=UPI001FB1236E|nr:uncharacterized protein LOC107858714 [Capsicum annuum]